MTPASGVCPTCRGARVVPDPAAPPPKPGEPVRTVVCPTCRGQVTAGNYLTK
jgi:ferredoxin